MDSESLIKRIEERVRALGLSERAASIATTGKPDLIRMMKVKGSLPRADNILQLSKVLKCSVEWLLTGKNSKDVTLIFDGHDSSVQQKVPLISSVQAGTWADIGEVLEPHQVEKWIPTTINVGPRAFALTVVGDSMTNPYGLPSIPEGVAVIVDPDCSAESGKIVIAQDDISNNASIKKLIVDGPNVYLRPLNPNYDTLKLKKSGRIIGVVRGMYQEFDG